MWAFYGWIALSFVLGLAGTWLFWWFSHKTGFFLDGTNGRKVHDGKIPRGAGVIFFLPFFIWALFDHNGYRTLIIPGTILLAVGVLDDLVGMKAWIKLILQTIIAVITYFIGFKITALSLGVFSIPLVWPVALLFTVFFIVGMMNAVNFVDGLDGLAGSLAIVAFVVLAYIGQAAGLDLVRWGALMMAAALAGFLFLNSPPAKVFMGDMGSHFIGYLLALMCIQVLRVDTGFLVIPAILVVVFPVMDTFFAIIRRLRHRRHIFGADMNHLHHRVLARTGSIYKTVFIMLGVGIVSGILAVVTGFWPWLSLPVGTAVFLLMMTWGVLVKAI